MSSHVIWDHHQLPSASHLLHSGSPDARGVGGRAVVLVGDDHSEGVGALHLADSGLEGESTGKEQGGG